jgi:hypothetical protein
MKKVIAIILLIVMCFVLVACNTEETIDPVIGDTARFQYIGKSKLNQNGAISNYGTADEIQYFVDNETQIIYIAIVNHAGNGTWAGFTPLIDADGTYVTYDEFKED